MTPREFLKRYSWDRRLVTGAFFPSDSLRIERGDTVGVVLFNLGGPDKQEDVAPFLYNLFMDPAIIDIPVGGLLRHALCRLISSRRSRKVGKDYEAIGGGSPINRLTREQARALEERLMRDYGRAEGVVFRTYPAMRYWRPFSEDAAEKMQRDGVNKVVLLPLYPQYSKTTTGASLAYWHALQDAGEIPTWETTSVFEYAGHPAYVQAVSERIDEALQRFHRSERSGAHLLFSAHGTPLREMKERRDPYCCLIHSTVDRVMAHRKFDYPYHVSFQSKVGPMEWLTPSTVDKVEELGRKGVASLVVVPIAFVTDHIETAFELDVELREDAEAAGVRQFEVMSGLNCHPLFMEALSEAVVSQLAFGPATNASRPAPAPDAPSGVGDVSRKDRALCPLHVSPRPAERRTRCGQCEVIAEARRWAAPVPPLASEASA